MPSEKDENVYSKERGLLNRNRSVYQPCDACGARHVSLHFKQTCMSCGHHHQPLWRKL